MIHLDVAEFAAPESHAYFEREMPHRIGMSFAHALAQTDRLVAEVESQLPTALSVLDPDHITVDTLATLADLQSLTMVTELRLPKEVAERFTTLMTRAGIAPYTPVPRDAKRLESAGQL